MDITSSTEWQALLGTPAPAHLRELFANDPGRAERYTSAAGDLRVDWSKHLIDDSVMQRLFAVARAAGIEAHRDAMFAGDRINVTEQRSVLHTVLRAPRSASVSVDGVDVVPEVHAVLDKMADFSERVRSGAWKGHTGKRIRNVVNIGIGGSDLGPVMAYEALEPYRQDGLSCRFISNTIDTGNTGTAMSWNSTGASPHGVWGALGTIDGGDRIGEF